MSDYKHTLNLPQTNFPMKGNLVNNEPITLKKWDTENTYTSMVNTNAEQGTYTLHDGPPYANGHLHIGHALNKILKDIVIKYKNLNGYQAAYIPGWDCHGLPIELKVEQELGNKKDFDIMTVRAHCREYAKKWVDIQREEFKRFGCLGTWDNPYLTMLPAYEAATAKTLIQFMEKGSVERHKKPIYWCNSCETALAEAEVEYADHTSSSIYIRFPIIDQKIISIVPNAKLENIFIIIWTTTPWTIPANMAVCVHPEFEYNCIKVDDNFYIVASELLANCCQEFAWENYEIIATFMGESLENIQAKHPFYDRISPIILGSHVTLEAGTGCVHTAPGHGQEDYEVGLKYNLEILSPLDDRGHYLPTVEFFGGMYIEKANKLIIEKLQDVGHLLKNKKIKHSYPHCWRCKKPIIYRATTQWFIMLDNNDLRKNALETINNEINWIPNWGKDRIHNMIANRPDWCISRQRNWGVPIIALLCKNCGEAWFDPSWGYQIVEKIATYPTGADYWFATPLEEIVPKDLICPCCQEKKWEKETDILDVWFDSGTSWAAMQSRTDYQYPADLYLEGSDQHRGWFHSSLLASVGINKKSPYKTALTHGFVVDGNGYKMSKSVGNVLAPQEIIGKYGAEILRLWVFASNYQEDLRISDEIIKRLVDAYRRIRNTCRFIIGNLYDFDPSKDTINWDKMLPLDRYAYDLIREKDILMQTAYEKFEFHKIYHQLHALCVVELGSTYLDVVKDRLYVSPKQSLERRSAQTTLYFILTTLLKNIAPVLSFTAEELFEYFPETIKVNTKSIFAYSFPKAYKNELSDTEKKAWELALNIRAEITKLSEPLRQEKILGHSLDSAVILYISKDLEQTLAPLTSYLQEFFIVSNLKLEPEDCAPKAAIKNELISGLSISIARAPGEKCGRCWIYNTELGSDPEYADACPRCTKVLKNIG